MRRIRIAVIGGGTSNERGISLQSSRRIAAALPRTKYAVQRITFSGNLRILLALSGRVDVAFIALHGTDGEDGTIQAALELLGIPYTGSNVLASALGMDKGRCLQLAASNGIRVPRNIPLTSFPANIRRFSSLIARTLGYPCVVKPNASGSSIGVTLVANRRQLPTALRKAFREDSQVLVEQYIRGRELTCGIIGNSGRGALRAFAPIEIIPHKNRFFDYRSKYQPKGADEICPARIPKSVTTKVRSLSKRVHLLLGCDGVTRSDFILSPSGGLFFLEINTIPGQTEGSLVPKEAEVAGISFSQFVDQ